MAAAAHSSTASWHEEIATVSEEIRRLENPQSAGGTVRLGPLVFQPNCTASIDTEPPSMPCAGNVTGSPGKLAPSTYSSGR